MSSNRAGRITPPVLPSPAAGADAPRSAGLRYGLLFGPAVFGVTAAGVALPEVASDLGASASAATWVLTAHALALGIGTALFGRLADSRGLRPSLLAGSFLLLVGTVLCLAAPDLGALVTGRFVLAAGSGAMVSGALALTASSTPAQRARVLAGFGATMAVFSASATLAGGALTQWLTWRLTLVLPALSLFAVPLCLRAASTRRGSGRALDLPGAALLTATAAAFLLLVQTPALGTSAAGVVALAALLLLAGAGLARRIRSVPASFVPLRLIADRVFLRASVVGVGVYAGLFAAVYAVPQVLVRAHGWDVLAIGLWLLPGAVVGAGLSRVAGKLTAGAGGGRLLAVTALVTAVAMAASAARPGPVLLIVGASLGFGAFAVVQVVATALLSTRVEPALRGGAMGLLNLTFFVGGAVGSAAAGALAPVWSPTTALGVLAGFPLVAALVASTLAPQEGQASRTLTVER
ncbi:MFS transporter [Streptomyces sp. NPDC059578]|uniref:MFS transporter n=1 Tax=Streptomyces sp. NPDC059578 TaxID=3346874 RepID=UPI0036AAB137